ncbi:MAG: aldo/keto reductase [Methylobacterium mesophilicum]|nr:aldo/keto reductase [Methylobacterium mesophilicum]
MTDQPRISFNDGNSIPQIGLGVWQTPNAGAADAVRAALEAGYRHIDTAAAYNNEGGVGEGIRASGLGRDEVFVTTKIWNEDQGYDRTLKALDASLKRLKMDRVDLILIHWPSPQRDLFVDTWRALIKAREAGQARSIGVSNFEPEHLDRIVEETGVTPVLNQVELHPGFEQKRLRAAHSARDIRTESWSPLGQGKVLNDPVIAGIAAKYGKTPAQVIIRWHLDNGLIVIPKSVTPSRIRENFDVFGFKLDSGDMERIAGLEDVGGRIGPNPMTATF